MKMKIVDISQEIFGCKVYPGDPAPERQLVSSIEGGDLYNLTCFNMCAHNGTHIDAPFHFIKDGETVESIPLEKFVGPCFVAEHEGTLTAEDAAGIIGRAGGDTAKRILIKGNATVSYEAAKVFADKGIYLLGNESQTIGPENAPMQVHKELLNKGVVLLEGVRLEKADEGEYLLNAAPLNLAGADGAPCRAILIKPD